MSRIHPTAIIESGAELHPSVEVGPYSIIGPQVKIGEGTKIGSHAVISGDTTIGKGARFFQFCSVGEAPQDLKYRGQPTRTVIGDNTVVREFATLHRGTEEGGGITKVGSRCLLMAYSHVAHDVQIGDGVILGNSSMLAGHVIVEDHVIFGGMSGIHQFTRIGRNAFIGGGSMVGMDVPPFCTASGYRAELAGLNTVGLTRHKFTEDEIRNIKKAYRTLFRMKLGLREALTQVRAELPGDPNVEHMLRFIEGSQRGVTR
ncbi:acyl-ACP--UDP-N-acetylglucosamine O-acyltransferase [Vulgatibacter incomptus]|uniref:Acyl-[acyl-carrier-protein]--UDP-N-acetylglucosamine O-acyltransferase n=1 Tax=Vulgatibacter incomptus TaxID=1391653 RepID=A0A0K1PDB7_9BACT|nr:acyl-ACP--UDP-N-acetylglucosamine O-acyltransferase [Vulgatibacter incomptus]AKU91515.1 Acyl-[acyl-carrier-protein]--UDP-N-acetylglucosamine O-acyltransferase [Vulgatibacter incomptus]